MKAIVCMASNRVIGSGGKMPWPRIDGDMKFFSKMTKGGVMIMGRKTFNSLPKDMKLGGRRIIVLTRSENPRDIFSVTEKNSLNGLPTENSWLCGGAEIYKQLLPECTDLYITRLFKSYEGDTFFPSFEHLFIQQEVLESNEEYAIIHYRRKTIYEN